MSFIVPANKYLFKFNNGKTIKRCEICSKLTLKIPQRPYWCRFGVFIADFEHISHLFLVFQLLFEQVNACCKVQILNYQDIFSELFSEKTVHTL